MIKESRAPLYYKQNRLKQLRAFCMAAKTRSISRAAEQLFQSQSTVTLQIQALEREMGLCLFERRGRRMALTPEGEVLRELAQPLQASLRSRERFWDIRVPKIDSIFDNSLVPLPSWSPGVPPQHRKLVAATHRSPI